MTNIELIEAVIIAVTLVNLIIWNTVVNSKKYSNDANYALTFITDNRTTEVMVVTIVKDQSLVSAINQCYAKFTTANVHDVRLIDIKKL